MAAVSVPAGDIRLPGELIVPDRATGVVMLFQYAARGLPSWRRVMAKRFRDAGLGTLLIDLLGPAEQAAGRMGPARAEPERFSRRVMAVTEWLHDVASDPGCAIGYFACGRAAAVALLAAANEPDDLSAVVCACGRPDLAVEVFPKIGAATLLIVDGRDPLSTELNHRVFAYLRCERHLEVAGRGVNERVAELATSWFLVHVPALA